MTRPENILKVAKRQVEKAHTDWNKCATKALHYSFGPQTPYTPPKSTWRTRWALRWTAFREFVADGFQWAADTIRGYALREEDDYA